MFGSKIKRTPIGYEDFKRIIDGDFYYVDKTMLIYDILNGGSQNNLITRPRRFGKTLNLSMLEYFFSVTEKDNSYIFDGLEISKHYDELSGYRNAYPVISLSLKGAKCGDYNKAVMRICEEIKEKFSDYSFILESDRLNDLEREGFKKIIKTEPDSAVFASSIKLLSRCLKQYYGKNVIILIDEYDVPLEDAYFAGYYDDMVSFIRSLFEAALKTNKCLEFSVITGCLRISKESIFTGLNNLRSNTILDKKYAEYFGFEEFEIRQLLSYYGFDFKLELVKNWYDGYLFGDKEIYNPWSIMNYVDRLRDDPDCFPTADWVNSSSNAIIRRLVQRADPETKGILERLVAEGSVETSIKGTITYGDMDASEENIWSFLYFTGYLRIKAPASKGNIRTGAAPVYSLVIPNIEVRTCYIDIISQYFNDRKKQIKNGDILNAMLNRETSGFTQPITALLQSSISFYDNTESFYHGLLTGLVSGNPVYEIRSNRETGQGRSDIAIYQNDRFNNAIIIEIRVCRPNEDIESGAKRALKQINDLDYASEARELGYKNIIKYGIAFKSKSCFAVTG